MIQVAHADKVRMVVFRTDASLQIGAGHVMRCLTLAEALKEQGVECHFLCREHSGHLVDMIEERGFTAHRLPALDQDSTGAANGETLPVHAHWLGATWQDDVATCWALLDQLQPDWLVVDHYALDARWEEAVLTPRTRLLVIDDLADRPHRADLLLDQNLGHSDEDYAHLVSVECRILVGPRFALLRPEFAQRREYSLTRRRHHPQLKRLLISLGGVDKDNATGKVLEALRACDLPDDCEITVVMGATAPWLDEVKAKTAELPWRTDVVVNVPDMARRMAEADLAIGAAGSTSWERCCLGLPTLMLVLAENQRTIAESLHDTHAALYLGDISAHAWISQLKECVSEVLLHPSRLQGMASSAADVTSGTGVVMLVDEMMEG
ncbi:UDP-2,4-diacetamido-2,4,6-trideoxy-beta-L-altropyranose hydrolase [Halomonas sp. M4R1S46]|uniref:UDP-2,4-diacetamido-2,4, 6-trideoxy-beta-L-altropyranose hydrolase n=1 Tax=Halomonas sp. M4R1S46 TaxID=2982692 RepID=UPI0021E47D74|nr:UDP-2,4-diacetamido-2,4,6-trideoxy-beta-L-altropyranose hydrolase [Halomonas sp. M4R1S46]UYG06030.1 UDP-2,4-diacetamido-2,4,6-trideoxy-beta-L-altropyranose hydrolase [Halomonas sp. M4R1S46]